MPDKIGVGVHGPYEDLAIEVIRFARDIILSAPEDVRRQLWEMHLEDVKGWRAFWQNVAKLIEGGAP